MAKVKTNSLKKKICDNCHGNGYIRIAVGDTSIDFRDRSEIHQCWTCDSEGEFYETVDTDLIDDGDSDTLH